MFKLLHPAALSAAALTGALLLATPAAGQRIAQPQASPAASVTQTIGLTDVAVTCNRPAVKGRTVWGKLVPYGEVWRAGANANTTVRFSGPVKIEGKDLAAGTYGLHMIPTATTWTVIFSRNSTSWGSYSYSDKEDALRVTVTPVKTAPTEWLTYDFTELSPDGATLSLRWDTLAVPLKLTVDTQKAMLENLRTALSSAAATDWQLPNSAAAYCLANAINLEEALEWSDASLAIAQNYTNMIVNAGLLEALGRTADAEPMRQEALALATEQELNNAGFQYLESNQLQKALETFKAGVAAHPESADAHEGLAQAMSLSGDKAVAIENYRKALQLTQDAQSKARIEGALKTLGAM